MAKKTPTIAAKKVANFADVIGERHLTAVSVGPRLDPVIISLASNPSNHRIEKNGGSFAKRRADCPNEYAIHFQAGDDWSELSLPETKENLHHVQPLGKDQWLAVRARSAGDGDPNAHMFNANGRLVRSFPAGDGIQDVQTDEAGKIWVSYFDEGVFGDCKLSRSGLVCLDGHGRCVFDFFDVPHECVRSMADCYALNVCSSREVWLCYYTDFPLVQLLDHKVGGVWRSFPVAGSPAFAVLGQRTLFSGGYKKRESLFDVDLKTLRPRELVPVDHNGSRIRKFWAFGRRSSLFLGTEESLYVVDLAELT